MCDALKHTFPKGNCINICNFAQATTGYKPEDQGFLLWIYHKLAPLILTNQNITNLLWLLCKTFVLFPSFTQLILRYSSMYVAC